MLNLQALSSYFIIASSKSCYRLTVYDKASEFCAVHGSLHCCTRRKRKIRTLLQSETGSDFSCLVGAGGFEPPKLKAADLQSVPIGHSGTRPYSFCKSCRPPVYDNTEFAACQQLISFFGSGGSSLHNGYRRSTQNKGAHSCSKRAFPEFVALFGHFAAHTKAKIPRYTPPF